MLRGSSPITFTLPSSKARQKSGPFAPPALPGFVTTMTPSDSRRRPSPDVTLRRAPRLRRVSLVARTTMRTCRAHYPGGSERVHVSIASPFCFGLPQTLGGSASASSFSRPAQASLALRPARSLNRPRRPLSRGFDGASRPATPPVSDQLNRQLAGWNPPPEGVSRLRGAPEFADVRPMRVRLRHAANTHVSSTPHSRLCWLPYQLTIVSMFTPIKKVDAT